MSEPGPTATRRRLDRASTRDVARALGDAKATLVVPLGSTEQHGAHLPLCTDTVVADALAERLLARRPEAWAMPALPLGCADEHLGFAGTLSLAESTLHAVVGDLIASARTQGFARVFVYSAHGGNAGALRRLAPAVTAPGTPPAVCVFTDLDAVLDAQARVAATFGVSAEAAGLHAGEWETSVIASLAPDAVRMDRAEAGHLASTDEGGSLFYPRLDVRVPSGVVGDPRAADPARADAYLEAWVDVLDAAWAAAFDGDAGAAR